MRECTSAVVVVMARGVVVVVVVVVVVGLVRVVAHADAPPTLQNQRFPETTA
ncbi:MAG: hypothetical protein ACKVI4_17600 [Actinomycetales bacterium]